MRIRSRAVRVLMAAALLAGGLTATTGTLATAAPNAVQSCLGTAKPFSTTYAEPHFRWPRSGSVTATSSCNDINVKPVGLVWVSTCFLPTSGGTYCNGWHEIKPGTWGLAATDVLDGTKFYLQFYNAVSSDGYVAY
ncbi:hypothetical protein KQY30_00100 [Streptomyces sp. GMY02]|uniref:hypothetical protein n=1 Tax=Streptomyces sp. GMY02 TaxID=1333528 RepID=UPI001C2C5BC8|nr:hypothetical protein [Streptomyces sp. GMY02]QXE32931.1 hypothetical protein KQY30_00100 [Streptomyces sp. GMY02]